MFRGALARATRALAATRATAASRRAPVVATTPAPTTTRDAVARARAFATRAGEGMRAYKPTSPGQRGARHDLARGPAPRAPAQGARGRAQEDGREERARADHGVAPGRRREATVSSDRF